MALAFFAAARLASRPLVALLLILAGEMWVIGYARANFHQGSYEGYALIILVPLPFAAAWALWQLSWLIEGGWRDLQRPYLLEIVVALIERLFPGRRLRVP